MTTNRRRQASHTTNSQRPRVIMAVAVLMIVFGAAEAVTGVTHRFFGVPTSSAAIFTYANAATGGVYAAGGLMILTMKKWAAVLAIVVLAVLIADLTARIALVATGLFPLWLFPQITAILVEAAMATVFAIYTVSNWRHVN